MEKIDGKTKDLVGENREVLVEMLKDKFPEVVSEGDVDLVKLSELLGGDGNVDSASERYNFTWAGKAGAIRNAMAQSSGTLRVAREDSVNWDSTENIYIEGDNLEVLKLLQKSYARSIKMIYIDPPYNTGNDFVYKDDFKDNIKNYLQLTGQVDSDGKKLSTNTETSGRYHSDWLNMMYPRLKLARNLLKDDGVIFISIDDNEVSNLRKLCDEIFGEENFVNLISIKAKASSGASGGGEDRKLKKNIEYLMAYAKTSSFESFAPVYQYTPLDDYISERKKTGKNFAYTSVLTNPGKEEYVTTIKAGNGDDIEIKKVTGYEIKSISKLARELSIPEYEVYEKYIDIIYTLENAQTSIRDKVLEATGSADEFYNCYYKPISGKNKGVMTKVGFMGTTKRLVSFLRNVVDVENNKIIKKDKIGTLWDDLSWSSVHLEGDVKYTNGKKPVSLIKRLLSMQKFSEGDIILDFFAGSSTSAHSLLEFNKENLLNSKYILVQIPESLDSNLKQANNSKAKTDIKSQITFLDSINKPHYITEIGKERIRRVIKKLEAESPAIGNNQDELNFEAQESPKAPLDLGFKVFKLDSSNFSAWDTNPENLDEDTLLKHVNNIKENRSTEDILYELLLKLGEGLNTPYQKVKLENKTVFDIAYGSILACLDDDLDMQFCENLIAYHETLFPKTDEQDSTRSQQERKEDSRHRLETTSFIFKDTNFKDPVIKSNIIQTLRQLGFENIKVI